jgi:hypothetical protein
MCANALNFVLFYLLDLKVADAFQQDITRRILMGENNAVNNADCRNIGLMQLFAQHPLNTADIEQIGAHIYDAAKACSLIDELMAIVPMLLYGRMAYLHLPEARDTLYLGWAATAGACFLQRFIFLQ